MKRSIFFVFIMLLLTGCASVNASRETVNEEDGVTLPYFSEEIQIETGVFDFQMDWTKTEKMEAAKSLQKEINQLSEDICYFFNLELGANWEPKPVEVIKGEVTRNMGSGIAACYYDGKIFIDKSYNDNKLQGEFKFLVVHELIHFLSHSNNGENARFAIQEDDGYIGVYLEEAFVDSLARKYMLARDPDVSERDMVGGYNQIRMMVDLLQLSLNDTYIYFFNNDIEGLKQKVDKLATRNMVCLGSAFEKWTYLMDLTYASNNIGDLNEKVSILLSFMAVNTPAEKASEFTSRLEIEGIKEAEMFIPAMY